MKVYTEDAGKHRLIGRADIPADEGPVYELSLFGAASTITEHYMIQVVMSLQFNSPILVDRGVVLRPGQRPELLPGWTPLAS